MTLTFTAPTRKCSCILQPKCQKKTSQTNIIEILIICNLNHFDLHHRNLNCDLYDRDLHHRDLQTFIITIVILIIISCAHTTPTLRSALGQLLLLR